MPSAQLAHLLGFGRSGAPWVLVCLLATAPSSAGEIGLGWEPVAGAEGYRVYWGEESGSYSESADAGVATGLNLVGLQDCRPYFAAVTAYNDDGESAPSNEVTGWARPEIAPGQTPVVVQGRTQAIQIAGANFASSAELGFEETDLDGNPLIRATSISVPSCQLVEALVAVEPAARGFRAMPIGLHDLYILNPDGVVGTAAFEVALDIERLDVSRSNAATSGRINGTDLAWLASSYATREGEQRFNADADIDGDGFVDGNDLALLATVFGSCWSGTAWDLAACPQ